MLIVISSAADSDIQSIWDFIAIKSENPAAANRILIAFRDAFLALSSFPEIGHECHGLSSYVGGLRCLHSHGYEIYYRIENETVQIGRIIHPRRDRDQTLQRWLSGAND